MNYNEKFKEIAEELRKYYPELKYNEVLGHIHFSNCHISIDFEESMFAWPKGLAKAKIAPSRTIAIGILKDTKYTVRRMKADCSTRQIVTSIRKRCRP